MINPDYKVIAVMSGTSLDGIDIIYASYRYNENWEFEIHHSVDSRVNDEYFVEVTHV